MLAPSAYTLRRQPRDIRLALAARFKRVRKAAKLTQAELAERSTVSLGSLRRFETTGRVSLESLAKLADVLGRLEELDGLFAFDEKLAEAERLLNKSSK